MAKASSNTKNTLAAQKGKKGKKGRNYYAGVGDKNNKSDGKTKAKENVKHERKEYAEVEKWSKAKKKRMRKLLAKQRTDNVDGVNSKDLEELEKSEPLTSSTTPPPNKKQKKQKEETNKSKETKESTDDAEPKTEKDHVALFSGSKVPSKMSDLQKSFLDRLSGSRFRILNEELYTKPSKESLERFQSNPDLFQQYHEGFRTQVQSWPVNPIDVILRWILDYAAKKDKKKNTSKNENPFVVADFGCGDAKLAKEILSKLSNDKMKEETNEDETKSKKGKKKAKAKASVKVHSFDLVDGGNPLITACDMANTPIPYSCVDVAVFCLALMGTNVADFIREAHRVMRSDGVLKIAEVRSRFETTSSSSSETNDNKKGKKNANKKGDYEKGKVDESSLTEFVDAMSKLGFICKKMDRSNQMFVMFDFEKNGQIPNKEVQFSLRPCIYKRR